ncbi:MAG: hypothetical protein A2X22_13940 [Bacteroidetes bacterium GWF2_49_14]|nr:MAG: hypothetical protein A2X22_13940 [Bacteroidetes bacterium GWF2_49_14]HBB90229.1 hypothetical protein [Bacteroidales bacterium]
MDENNLIEMLRAGDPAATRNLVDHYQPLVLKTARGFVRNTEDARDIAQDVFIDVITNLHRFRRQSGLSTWIYRITVNRSLNYIRSKRRRNDPIQSDTLNSEGHPGMVHNLSDPSEKNPGEILEYQDRSRILHDALESLPERQRTALALAEFDELSYKEISEVMELSLSSVESLIFRAKKNLQKKLWHCYKKSC